MADAISSDDYVPPADDTGIDCRNAIGLPTNLAEADDSCIVNVGGVQMEAKTAATMGLLKRNDRGFEINNDPAPAPEPEAPAEEPMAALPDDQEQHVSRFANEVSVETQIRTVEEIIKKGELSDNQVNNLASELMIHPDEARSMIDTVVAGFAAQAAQALGPQGADMIAWANREKPELVHDAMRKQAYDRSLSGFSAIATEWAATLDTRNNLEDIQSKLDPRVTAFKGIDGRVVLRFPGGQEIPFADAVRNGHLGIKWNR